ncbi:MAG TPA: hypothetical protein VNH17_21065, partial [Streptosporangiaceae bacterium]|nr:hypothetical protein [Streptosporangiaceae bacterium]
AAGKYRSTYFDIKGDCTPRERDVAGVRCVVVKNGDDPQLFKQRRVVYRPAPGTFWRTDDGWADVLQRFFNRASRGYDHKRRRAREPRLVIIPEILLFGPRSQRVIGEIASGARNLQLGLWVETQRPRRIPVVTRSEAWRIYIFSLGYEDDELEVLKYGKGRLTLEQLRVLDQELEAIPPRHPFIEVILRSKSGGALSVRQCAELDLVGQPASTP